MRMKVLAIALILIIAALVLIETRFNTFETNKKTDVKNWDRSCINEPGFGPGCIGFVFPLACKKKNVSDLCGQYTLETCRNFCLGIGKR